METILLTSTHLHPKRAAGEQFTRPRPDGLRLIERGWAVLPENWVAEKSVSVLPRPIKVWTIPRPKGKRHDKCTTAYIATFAGRQKALAECIESLKDQVDRIVIWDNSTKVDDLGDIGKFAYSHIWEGYVFTCDDKLIYPPDYVETMIQKIEHYNRNAVVSVHGRNIPKDCKSYYRGCPEMFNYTETVKEDVRVDEIGTGVMAFHWSLCKDLPMEVFEHTNMTDIYFSKWLNERGTPRIVVAHEMGWIQVSKMLKPPQISAVHRQDDALHTRIVNEITWKR